VKQEGLKYFTDTWMTLVGLMIFFTYFTYMVIKVIRCHPEYIQKMSELPLKEEKNSEVLHV
jgi:cytochrome c oxidase cbb3-type subunit 4